MGKKKKGSSLTTKQLAELHPKLAGIQVTRELADEIGLGGKEETLKDLISELLNPGRDVRGTLQQAPRTGVLTMKDLEVGTEMEGVIRNIVTFGAFCDIALEKDGLIYIGEMPPHFRQNLHKYLSIGQQV